MCSMSELSHSYSREFTATSDFGPKRIEILTALQLAFSSWKRTMIISVAFQYVRFWSHGLYDPGLLNETGSTRLASPLVRF
jgi:hypothetical protein